MGHLKKYAIPFAGLKPGTHHFEFELGDSFFKEFEHSEITEGAIRADLTLIRQSTMMILDFTISGSFDVNCDRCAIPCSLPVSGRQQLVVKLGAPDGTEVDGEVITLPLTESEIDLAPYLFEYVNLSLPAKRVACEILNDDSICDKEMIKKLEQLSAKPDDTTDERWDKLKNFKIN